MGVIRCPRQGVDKLSEQRDCYRLTRLRVSGRVFGCPTALLRPIGPIRPIAHISCTVGIMSVDAFWHVHCGKGGGPSKVALPVPKEVALPVSKEVAVPPLER